jgi:hypothetical protein
MVKIVNLNMKKVFAEITSLIHAKLKIVSLNILEN